MVILGTVITSWEIFFKVTLGIIPILIKIISYYNWNWTKLKKTIIWVIEIFLSWSDPQLISIIIIMNIYCELLTVGKAWFAIKADCIVFKDSHEHLAITGI